MISLHILFLSFYTQGFCNKITPVAPVPALDTAALLSATATASPPGSGSGPGADSDIELSIAGLTLSPSSGPMEPSSNISPVNSLSLTTEPEQLRAISTADYKLVYWESLSGLRLVLTTDPCTVVPMGIDVLKKVFTLYADCIVKSPLYTAEPPTEAAASVFNARLDAYLATLAFFG